MFVPVRSVIVRINLEPLDSGRGPMKSVVRNGQKMKWTDGALCRRLVVLTRVATR